MTDAFLSLLLTDVGAPVASLTSRSMSWTLRFYTSSVVRRGIVPLLFASF